MPGDLYLVATPIGNLDDITARAVDVLKSVDLIACEDTRHTRKLLNHLGIKAKLISYHEHNEVERVSGFVQRMAAGESIAIVSDAGTPGINDPGAVIVGSAIEAGINVIPIPGAVAFVSAAVASGLPTDSIFFGGFLPARQGDRRKRLEELKGVPATLVLYESPHRLARSLNDCLAILGDRRAAVARELTKIHEQVHRGSVSELAKLFTETAAKGEIVLILDRASAAAHSMIGAASVSELVTQLERKGHDRKAALKLAAKELGISRSEAYRQMLAER